MSELVCLRSNLYMNPIEHNGQPQEHTSVFNNNFTNTSLKGKGTEKALYNKEQKKIYQQYN